MQRSTSDISETRKSVCKMSNQLPHTNCNCERIHMKEGCVLTCQRCILHVPNFCIPIIGGCTTPLHIRRIQHLQ
jgi:hypothetical protein